MDILIESLRSGVASLADPQMLLMWVVVGALLYLGIEKKYEPLLLVPIALGALLANLPIDEVIMKHPGPVLDAAGLAVLDELGHPKMEAGGLFYYIKQGVSLGLFPPIIFLGVGALTDFGPLIANPRTLLLGAAAQFGIFATFFGAIAFGFAPEEAAAIGIIGGADGPTSIYVANALADNLMGPIAVAAYSYMALVPVIQPPIMRLLTTQKERQIRMKSLRKVSRLEKLLFALIVMVFCLVFVPDSAPLVSMLFIGNIIKECGVTDRLAKAAQNEIINIVTIFLGLTVGLKMSAKDFLDPETLKILALGIIAFVIATSSGVLMAKVMNLFMRKNKINPLIGSAGVSAVPMAARVSHVEGQKADKGNFLLMHAMGPNVAGVLGSALAAGYFISAFGG